MEKAKLKIDGMAKKLVVLTVLTIGIYLTFRYLLPLVLPFVVAGIVSVLYYPFLRKICKKAGMWSGKRKKWILVIAVTLFYVMIFLLIGLLGVYLFGQGQSIILNFPFYQAKAVYLIKSCCCQVDGMLHVEDGVSFTYIEGLVGNVWSDSMSGMIPRVTSYSVQMAGKMFGILFGIIITIITTFFMIQDYDGIREKMLGTEIGRNICCVIAKCKETLKAYVKAEGLIMLLDGLLCTIAFLLIGQPYFLILGPLVAIVDALPVLGAGIILIPYAFVMIFTKKLGKACILLLAYLGCLLIRQITEPKMVGGQMGLRPLYTIASMYIGFKLFGAYGFLLGPVGVLIGKELYSTLANYMG